MISLRFNTTQWHDTGAELRRWKKMDVPQFVKHRTRVAAQDLLKWTPPRGPQPSSESFRQQKKRGEDTIRLDVCRTFQAVDELRIVKDSSSRAGIALNLCIGKGDMHGAEKILRNLNFYVRGVLSEASPSIHRAAQNGRGRVKKKQGWWVLRASSRDPLIKQLQAGVGKEKSGWGAVARFAGVPSKNWPQWVQHHGDNGHVIARLTGNRPSVTMINDRPETQPEQQSEIVEAVMAANEAKMIAELKAILAYQTRKHSAR